MKDLILLNVALHDTIEEEVINFRKMAQLSLIFQELNQLQNSNPPIEVNMDLVNTLRVRFMSSHQSKILHDDQANSFVSS